MIIFIVLVTGILDSMRDLVNGYRNSAGLSSLKAIPSLENAARIQAQYMCSISRTTHNNPKGRLVERTKISGFLSFEVAENVGRSCSEDYKMVVENWMNSESDRWNILSDFDYTGLAVCTSKEGDYFWVQVFGKREEIVSPHSKKIPPFC